MKKSFVFIFSILCVFTSKAQYKLSNIYPSVEKKAFYYTFKLNPLASETVKEDNNLYIYRNSTMHTSNMSENANNIYKDFIYTIDSNGKLSVSAPIDVPANYYYQASFEKKDAIVVLHTYETKDQFGLYINEYAKLYPKWKPKQLVSYSFNKKDNFTYYISLSPDKTKIALCSILIDKENGYRGLTFTVFDNEGEKLWENTILPDFNGQTFMLLETAISNQGNVYVVASAYTTGKKGSSDEQFHLLEVSESDHKNIKSNEGIEYIAKSKMKFLNDGNLFVTGYYKEQKDDELYKGAYSMLYNTSDQSVINYAYKDFSKDIPEGYRMNLYCDEIFELPDGNLVSVGEQRSVTYYQSTFSAYYTYATYNLIYITYTKEGTINDVKSIFKSQSVGSPTKSSDLKIFGISYHAYQNDDNIYLLFNDDVDYTGEPKKIYTPTDPITKTKDCVVRMVEINGNNMTSKNLLDGKTSKKIMLSILFAYKDYLIVSLYSDPITIDKIDLE
jgi:hypothetical protein